MIRQAKVLIVLAAFGIGVLLGSTAMAVVLTKQQPTAAQFQALHKVVQYHNEELEKAQDQLWEMKCARRKGGFGVKGIDFDTTPAKSVWMVDPNGKPCLVPPAPKPVRVKDPEGLMPPAAP